MRTLSFKNPRLRLCLVVGVAVGLSQEIVRATTVNLGWWMGSLVSVAMLAGLAFGFCVLFQMLLPSEDSRADR